MKIAPFFPTFYLPPAPRTMWVKFQYRARQKVSSGSNNEGWGYIS
jgi:hypothetical protein